VKEAEGVVKGDDKAAIDAKSEALATAAQKLGEKMYAAEAAKAQAAQGDAGGAGGASHEAKHDDANVVDAEFTEVKDKK
jgi:molecular chaperone DnaK